MRSPRLGWPGESHHLCVRVVGADVVHALTADRFGPCPASAVPLYICARESSKSQQALRKLRETATNSADQSYPKTLSDLGFLSKPAGQDGVELALTRQGSAVRICQRPRHSFTLKKLVSHDQEGPFPLQGDFRVIPFQRLRTILSADLPRPKRFGESSILCPLSVVTSKGSCDWKLCFFHSENVLDHPY